MNKFLKALVIALCAIALVVGSVAATVAYLSMKTDPVKNTFTAGNISIDLKQDANLSNIKVMPGVNYTVDPKVIVNGGSEACWLFVKIDKLPVAAAQPSEQSEEPEQTEQTTDEIVVAFDTYMKFDVADGWALVPGETNVYYREVGVVPATDAEGNTNSESFDILKDNKVTAIKTCTKKQYDKLISSDTTLDLNFTAYAVQSVGFTTAAAAWAEAKTLG